MIVYWIRLGLCALAVTCIDDKGAFVYVGAGPRTLTAVCYGAEM
jgi:hypothetical protein